MAKKNNVNIKIAADVQDAKKGIDKITRHLDEFSKDANTRLSKLSKLGSVASGGGVVLSGVVKGFSAATQAISALSDAYDAQIKSERQLETAAKNNPYIDDYSVEKLKAFASEMQAVSAVGDETLLPLMSQLAAAGRTQTEIQGIMKTALDVSASGMMSLDSAVTALNKTFSGAAGTLGNQISELKSLTKEELSSGRAIEIVGEKFKGMSKSVADSTGGWQKFQNSLGDFMEVLGKPISVLKNFTGGVLSKIVDGFSAAVSFFETGKTKAKELREELERLNNNRETSTVESLEDEIALLEEDLKKRKERAEMISSANQEEIEAELRKQMEIRKTSEEEKKTLEKDIQKARRAKNAYSANKNSNEYKDAVAELGRLETELEKAKDKYKAAQDEISALNAAITNAVAENMLEAAQKGRESVDEEISEMETRLERLKEDLKAAKQNTPPPSTDMTKADRTALDAQKEYSETMRKLEENIRLRRQTGETIDEEVEKQLKLNAMVQAYISAREKAGGTMSDGNQWVKNVVSEIQGLSEELDISKSISDFIGDGFLDAKEKILAELNDLDAEYERLMNNIDFSAIEDGEQKKFQIHEVWTKKRKELEEQLKSDEIKNTDEAAKAMAERVMQWMEAINNVFNTLASSMKSVSELVQQNAQNEAKVKQSELDRIYAAGILSEEAYYLQKEKIEKAAAKRQYQMQMAEWTSQISQATANTAVGATKSLSAAPYPVNAVLAAATIAAGAVQIGTIVANKPVPAYESGGIVGGSSYSGDRITANVNSGEMILNTRQQKALWETANGAVPKGGNAVNLNVRNYAGVSVTPQVTMDGIELLIKRTVNAGLEKGEFNSSLLAAENSQSGVRYSS